jgi:hypothetical protein
VFALLLWLCALPVLAICFFLGGVSTQEYFLALLLQLLTAFTGAIIGLFFSAWSRRASVALRKTFVTLIAWSIAAPIAFLVSEAWRWIGAGMGAGGGTNTANVYQAALRVFSCTHSMVSYSMLSSNYNAIPLPPVTKSSDLADYCFAAATRYPHLVSAITQGLLCLLLFWSVTRALRRPLAEQYWIERPRRRSHRGAQQNATTQNTTASTQTRTEKVRDSQWWEIPGAAWLRFRNPLLQREVHSKFRMRRVSTLVIAAEAVLGAGVFYFYLRAMWWAITERDARPVIWWIICFIALIIVMIATAVMGAGTFSREREGGTFESLFLSLLSNGEIMRAKVLAPVIACLAFGTPLLPLLALCVRGVSYEFSDSYTQPGISLTQAIGTLLILTATAWCYTAWGMLMSWLCRRTPLAVGWTVGTLFLSVVFVPILLAISSSSTESLWPVHPVMALIAVSSPSSGNNVFTAGPVDPLAPAIVSAGCLWVMGALCLLVLRHAMRHRARELDRQNHSGAARTG